MITSDYQHAERTEKAQNRKKAYLQSSLGNSGEVEEKEERLELLIHSGRKRKREGGSETT